VELPRPSWFQPSLDALLQRQDLESGRVLEMFRDILAGRVEDCLAAALVTAWRMKGETGTEIAAAATALREQMLRLVPIQGSVVDTCGTGGDGQGTFNISTAAALVVAGAGLPVVKHGNRAVSSLSGSADVLKELGVVIDAGPAWAQRCLDRIGFAFCYAPQFHAGMSHVSRLRKRLGYRTIFNLLGPLANPAGADYQILGVGKPELLDPLASALARLGIRRALVLYSRDGLDEVSLAAPTDLRLVEGHDFQPLVWSPEVFGLEPVRLADVQAASVAESAVRIRSILAGEPSPAARLTLANAATALFVAGVAPDLPSGVELAQRAIQSGKARRVLDQLVALRP